VAKILQKQIKTLMSDSRIYIALPLMDELENLPHLLEDLKKQTFSDFQVVVCVNQPDAWWDDPVKQSICRRNLATVDLLANSDIDDMVVIDRTSKGKGWDAKHYGVGWARKTVMDHISKIARPKDILLSLDGDTSFGNCYFHEIVSAFQAFEEIKAIAVPYFHPMPADNDAAARAILHYEIYMRHYFLNMLLTGNPYSFTALGSAMACTVDSYNRIGGITPHKSGEDFYFLQKLRKFGAVLIWLEEKVFPAARFSDRVFFGTGPAMIKGSKGDWTAYPIYPTCFFEEVKTTFEKFKPLYQTDEETPMSAFLQEKFGENFWEPLRKNARTTQQFERACQHKIDGLRILQYLKWMHNNHVSNDEENLACFMKHYFAEESFVRQTNWAEFNFKTSPLHFLNTLRTFLYEKENRWRKRIKILR